MQSNGLVALIEHRAGLERFGSSGFDRAVRVVQRLGLLNDGAAAGIVFELAARMMTLGKGRGCQRGNNQRRESQLGRKRIHRAFSKLPIARAA